MPCHCSRISCSSLADGSLLEDEHVAVAGVASDSFLQSEYGFANGGLVWNRVDLVLQRYKVGF